MQLIQIVCFLLLPYLIIKLTGICRKLGFISPILLCYVIGIILGNIPNLPVNKELTMTLSELTIPLAIPLILFSADLSGWARMAKKTTLSFIFVTVSVLISSSLAALFFSGMVDEYWKLSGMLVGVYTGGTPNLMAVGMGLNVRQETLVLANASDAIMGGIYFLFLLTGAKWLLGKFLPPFETPVEYASPAATVEKPHLSGLIAAFLLSAIFVGVSIGLSLLFTGKIEVALVMLVITTLGIMASFSRKVRSIIGAYEAGQYLILIFSLAIGTNTNLLELVNSSPTVFMYTAFVMSGAILIHLLLAAIFRMDTDTTIITSTAGIFGPAFIGPVAEGIKNREVVVSGLTCGLVGYAIGNYLGFLVAWLLMPK